VRIHDDENHGLESKKHNKKTNENENHYKKITNKKTEKIILTVED